jgi:hypothetical protein
MKPGKSGNKGKENGICTLCRSNNSIEQIRCDIMAKFKVEIERPLCISCESCNIEAAQSCPATCIHVYENGKKII